MPHSRSGIRPLCLRRFSIALLIILVSIRGSNPAGAISAPPREAHRFAVDETFAARARTHPTEEAILAIGANVRCRPGTAAPAIVTGSVELAFRAEGLLGSALRTKRSYRFVLPTSVGGTRLLLGPHLASGPTPVREATVRFDSAPECEIVRESVSARFDFAGTDAAAATSGAAAADVSVTNREALEVKHAPVIAIRRDQTADVLTDLPLLLTPAWLPGSRLGTRILRYVATFSDEDSEPETADVDGRLARYGRRTDVEWAYEVELDRDDRVIARRYQAGEALGFGHRSRDFLPVGKFLGESEHPILYNALFVDTPLAKHNVFSNMPSSLEQLSPTFHAHVPGPALAPGSAREDAAFASPWILAAADEESLRENKRSVPSTDFLYVRIRRLPEGPSRAPAGVALRSAGGVAPMANVDGLAARGWMPEITWTDGSRALSGFGRSTFDRFGEDLYGEVSYTAIPIGSARVAAAVRGEPLGGNFRVPATSVSGAFPNAEFEFYALDARNTPPTLERVGADCGTGAANSGSAPSSESECRL